MTLKPHAPRSKECKVCKQPFIPARPLQTVCNPKCAGKLGKLTRAKDRAETRARKEAIQTIPELIKVAQREFNSWVRARDAGKPCICCGKPTTDEAGGIRSHAVDAGHYRSVGSAPHLRFDESNCHAQLVLCNRWGAGRAVDYRIGLIARIGLEAVEALEADNTIRKWTREELRDIAAKYRAKRKELEKQE